MFLSFKEAYLLLRRGKRLQVRQSSLHDWFDIEPIAEDDCMYVKYSNGDLQSVHELIGDRGVVFAKEYEMFRRKP